MSGEISLLIKQRINYIDMGKTYYKEVRNYKPNTKDKVLNQTFKDLTKKRAFNVIGDLANGQSYYKYFPWDNAIKCIENGTIAFVEPSRWNDAYESLFYEADYSLVSSIYATHPRVYATCATNKKCNEPAWRIYSGTDNICVQFEIDRAKFRLALLKAIEDGDAIYEGGVQYLEKNKIDKIGLRKLRTKTGKEKNNSLYSDLIEHHGKSFSIDNYLNLLLLKRDDFEHEHESRFFIVKKSDINSEPDKAHENRNETTVATGRNFSITRGDVLILKEIKWIEILKGVVINAREDSAQYKYLYDAIKKMISENVDESKRVVYEEKLKPVPYLVYDTMPETLMIGK